LKSRFNQSLAYRKVNY